MNKGIRSILAGAMVLAAGAAAAQSTAANQQRCQQLSTEVQQQFQAAVQARVPKQDPTTFNQEGYDIKGIMSQDVTSGLGKLMSLDFSGIIDKIVQKGMDKALSKATSTFSSKMNGVLQNAGVQGVAFNGTQVSVNNQQVVGGLMNNIPSTSGVSNDVKGAVVNATPQSAGPYGPAVKR
jgi:hypothetical protein